MIRPRGKNAVYSAVEEKELKVFRRVYKVSTDTMLDNIEDEIFALEEFRKQNLSPENDDHSSFTYLDGIDHAISLLEDRRKTTLGITVPRDD